MNTLFYRILFLSIVFLSGCTGKKTAEADFVIPESHPAKALTIGWYAPVSALADLVGEGNKPKVVKDDSISAVMLYIVKSDEHFIDSISAGPMECAHLVIPIDIPADFKAKNMNGIESAMVCPINIVDQSAVLGNKYNDFGFATYSGEIDLNVKETETGYFVTAEIKTVNGLIGISANFGKEGEKMEGVNAMINPKPGPLTFFYGEESFTRISDGKGNLKKGGENLINALNVSGQPYFLRLDLDIQWAFDFYKE
jgi:hypothetical protein